MPSVLPDVILSSFNCSTQRSAQCPATSPNNPPDGLRAPYFAHEQGCRHLRPCLLVLRPECPVRVAGGHPLAVLVFDPGQGLAVGEVGEGAIAVAPWRGEGRAGAQAPPGDRPGAVCANGRTDCGRSRTRDTACSHSQGLPAEQSGAGGARVHCRRGSSAPPPVSPHGDCVQRGGYVT